MQIEIEGIQLQAVQIAGINEIGAESGNAEITAGAALPWLQDTPEQAVWDSWGATWRDVIVLDSVAQRAWVYNLTDNDLSVAAHYATLRDFILALAVSEEN
jgi:hypothetical protein